MNTQHIPSPIRCGTCTGSLNPEGAAHLTLSGKRVHEHCKSKSQARDEMLYGLRLTTAVDTRHLVPDTRGKNTVPTKRAYECVYDFYKDTETRKRYVRRVNVGDGSVAWFTWQSN